MASYEKLFQSWLGTVNILERFANCIVTANTLFEHLPTFDLYNIICSGGKYYPFTQVLYLIAIVVHFLLLYTSPLLHFRGKYVKYSTSYSIITQL